LTAGFEAHIYGVQALQGNSRMNTYVSVPVKTADFLKLADFLRAQGSDLDPVEAVSIAIHYWIENASWKPDLLPPGTAAMGGRGYTWKNKESHLFLPHDTVIRMQYRKGNFYAKVVADDIIYDGKSFSPAALANKIAGSSRNAWRDLWIKKPGMKDWVLADHARSVKVVIDGKEREI
jgi:hypothetical protein